MSSIVQSRERIADALRAVGYYTAAFLVRHLHRLDGGTSMEREEAWNTITADLAAHPRRGEQDVEALRAAVHAITDGGEYAADALGIVGRHLDRFDAARIDGV